MASKKKKPAVQATASQSQKESVSLRTSMQYILRGFVLAMFTFFPLNMSNNYTLVQAKERTFYLLLIFMVAAIAFVLFYQLTQGRKLQINLKGFWGSIRPYEIAVLVYWVVLSLSALTSPYREYVWAGATDRTEGYMMQCLYLFTCIMVGRFYKPSQKDFLVLCITGALVCGYGIFQFYGLDFFQLSAHQEYGPSLVLVSTVSNRNMASTFFTLVFCVGYVCFVQKSARWQWAFFPLTLIVFYMIALGDTESGYVGVLVAGGLSLALVVKDRHCAARLCLLLAGCFALLWVHGITYPLMEAGWPYGDFPPSNVDSFKSVLPFVAVFFGALAAAFRFLKAPAPKLSGKVWRIGWPIALCAIVLVLCLAMPVIAEVSGIRSLQQLSEILQGNIDDRFMTNRAFVWKRSLTIVHEHLWLGTGPDTFQYFFAPFQEEAAELTRSWFDKAHSEYIQTLTDEGLLGLLALLALYFTLFWQARKKYAHDPVVLASGVAMLCFAVQAIFNFSTPIVHPLVWTMWGVFAAAGRAAPAEVPPVAAR